MARLSALLPDGTTNYITNPAMRYDTTGWNAQGSTITRSLEEARFGIASLRVVTSGTSVREGAFFRVSALSGISDTVAVSAYVRGAGKVRIRLDNNVVGGTEYSSQRIDLDSDRWTRISIIGFSTGGNDMRLYVETDEDIPITRTFYIDGAQMERKSYVTTYCDGDQPGCHWNGMYHASLSERHSYSRDGGRWYELAGRDRQEQNLYMTVAGGLGLPPTQMDLTSYSVAPGGFVLGRKVLPRLIMFTFHAKHKTNEESVSLSYLHELRQVLIDLFNPDDARGEDVWLMYDDGLPLYFRARYDGGLDGEWDIRNQFVNSFPLRVLALDPYMVEDDREVQVLEFQDSRPASEVFEVIGRIDGQWSNMNYGVGNSVGDMELGRKGELWIAGSFELINFFPSAIDPYAPSKYIAYWDGTQWQAMPVGTTGTIINDIAIHPDGDVYATGVFSSIGGVAANNIARWDGSTWNALGSGLNADGLHISIDAFGNLYVGGIFTTAGGIAANYIAKWDGSQWHGLGQYNGFDADVNSIAVAPDGKTVYVGGIFTNQNGLTGDAMKRVAEYDVDTDRFTQIGRGFDSDVSEIVLAEDGSLYACGAFTLSGGIRTNYIAKFQGSTWLRLGIGTNATTLSLSVGKNGDLIAVGHFTQAGGVDARGIALWNGSTWAHLDVDISIGDTNMLPLSVQYADNGDVYIGGSVFYNTPTLFSAINYVDNIGSANAAPIVYISGPGRMRWLENQTTKQRIFFDLEVLDGEEVFLDFANGSVFSTQRGNLYHAILPGSDFHAFSLAPGENKIACYMTNDVDARVQLTYQPTHWGIDAVPVGLI